MNRRDFICCLGCGCAAGLLGCAVDQKDEMGETAMSPLDSSEWDISICGLNCAKCGLFESGQCGGCRGPRDRRWTADCHFAACSAEKGHRYCFECDDFPCERLLAFASDEYDHHRQTVENLKQMREMGVEAWIAGQEKAVFCPGWGKKG